MSETVIALLSGGIGAAVATGVMSIILYKIKRSDTQKDAQTSKCVMQTTAVRYLMLHAICNECEKYIARGHISYEERRTLHKWHDLYHDELGGNGDAKLFMEAVDELPLIIHEE